MINVDKKRITQAIQILLHNALKFTRREGSILISVQELEQADESDNIPTSRRYTQNLTKKCIRIDVTDTGKGIAPVSKTTLSYLIVLNLQLLLTMILCLF